MEDTDKQAKNNTEHLRPFQWKKGQSGNVMGRPKGKTMKEYARQFLERMSDDERDEWLEGLGKDTIWEMAEGKAEAKTDITSGGKPLPVHTINVTPINTDGGQNT